MHGTLVSQEKIQVQGNNQEQRVLYVSSLGGEGSFSQDAVRRLERLILCMVGMVSSFYQMVGTEGS